MSLPLIVTPAATIRLLKLPTGALSNVMIDSFPSRAAAASKLVAARVELGPEGLPGSTPRSAPANVMMLAEAGNTVNDRPISPARINLVVAC